jgi:hypothetical protein
LGHSGHHGCQCAVILCTPCRTTIMGEVVKGRFRVSGKCYHGNRSWRGVITLPLKHKGCSIRCPQCPPVSLWLITTKLHWWEIRTTFPPKDHEQGTTYIQVHWTTT